MQSRARLLCISLAVAALGQGTVGPLHLFYSTPAVDWQSEALPIGNGRLGAMIFGDPEHEHLQLNEISLWTGGEEDTGKYQNLADLFIDFPVTEKGGAYWRKLDLASAIHTIDYRAGGVNFHREYFASYPAQVLVFHFEADKPGAYSCAIKLIDAHRAPATAAGNTLLAAGTLNNGLAYETQVRVINKGGSVVEENGNLLIEKADSVTVLVGAGTNYVPDRSRSWRGNHPHERLVNQLQNAAARNISALRKAHIADYQTLFNRVTLNLGESSETIRALPIGERLALYDRGGKDPELEALFFQFGRYLLISSSRPDSLPANLQGLWNNSNDPPWRCDYHSNINIEMNYWPAEETNLAECQIPLFDYIESLRGVRTAATHDYYLNKVDPRKVERKSVRGWTVQTENNIFGGSGYKWNPPGSAWYAQHLWEHFDFNRNRAYLRVAYPVLKEVCQFWEDHLVAMPDGTLVTPDGWSPEHGPDEPGVTYDQEVVWDLFTNYIAASSALRIDEDYRAKVSQMREKLLKPRIGKWGQLQEWAEDRDDPKDEHRHISHLFAVYPGRQISLDRTPALAEAAKASLNARGDRSTGWAMAWRINLWARLRDGDHAYALLHNLLHIVGQANRIDYGKGGGVYSNLLDAHPPFQIDGNFGATAGIAEMLLQSQAGDIHLLPALPSAWPEGSVTGLRARHNLTVDLTWRAGKLIRARLQSPAAVRATLRYRERTVTISIAANRPAILDSNLHKE